MAEDLAPIGVDLRVEGLAGFERGMNRASRASRGTRQELGKFGTRGAKAIKSAREATGKLARSLKRVAKVAGVAVGAVAGLGALAVKKFGDFELQMARIGTLLDDGVSGMDTFGDSVKRASVKFGQDLGQTSEAVFQAISAGIPGTQKDVEQFQDVVGQAAAGGFTDMATVVDGLTTIINSYGLEASDARKVSDAFFVTNKLGKTTFEEISRSIGRVAPTAKALGVSYEELLAATVSMTKGGVKTSEVMSSLKAAFANIANPTKKAELAAKGVNVQFSLAALKTKGLSGFLNDLAKQTSGNTEAQIALFGSVEAFNAVARLASQEGLAEFNGAMQALERSSGATQSAFDRVSETTGFKLKQIGEAFDRFAVEVGAGLMEGLGLDQIKDIPGFVEEAAVTIREGAAEFARAFMEAFAPAFDVDKMDWKGLARDLGSAAGTIARGFAEVAKIFADMIAGAQQFLGFLKEIISGIETAGAKSKARITEAEGLGPTGAEEGAASLLLGPGKWILDAVSPQPSKRKKGLFGKHGGITWEGLSGEQQMEQLRVQREFARRGQFVDVIPKARQFKDIGGAGLLAKGGRSLPGARTENPYLQKRWQEFSKEAVQAGREFVGGLESTGQAVVGTAKNYWNVAVNMFNKTELKDKSIDKPRSFGARGRGDASITSTAEQRYLLFEDKLIPIADEYAFGHLLGPGQEVS